MPIPPPIQNLIDRLNQELLEIEPKISNGLNILRQILPRFPNNVILIQYFAYLNTISLFVDTARQQIQTIIDTLTPNDVSIAIIIESGEDLEMLLGRALEAKMRVERIYNFLEGLP
jgi:hypothetical protein